MKASLPARHMLAVVLFGAVVIRFGATAGATDWPNRRGPNHHDISQEKGWPTTWRANAPRQLWNSSVGMGYSSMSVTGARAQALGEQSWTGPVLSHDRIYCRNARGDRVYLDVRAPATADAKR